MKKYSGIFVPMVTPFSNGEIDWQSLEKLIKYYISVGVSGIIPCGSTGECSTLTPSEHEEIIGFTIDKVAGRTKVIAGTGANNTAEAVALTRYADSKGADAALVVSPYYNRPTQQGIYNYFCEITNETDIDIIIYNIPSRTGSNVEFETVKKLSKLENIKGIKEGAGDIQQMIDLTYHFKNQDFSILTGEDTLLYNCCALGGDGGIMAAATVCTEQLIEEYQLLVDQKWDEARAIDERLRPVIQALFLETNPIAVKYAVAQLFAIPYEVRSPMTLLGDDKRKQLIKVLGQADIILSHGKKA